MAGATNLTLDCPVEQLFRRYYSRLTLVSSPREADGRTYTRNDSLLNRGENILAIVFTNWGMWVMVIAAPYHAGQKTIRETRLPQR